MKLGISGASGQVGTAVIKYVQRRAPGANIIGISRNREQVAALGIEGRFGDFDEPESLAVAYKGLDKVLIIPGSDMTPGKRAVQNARAIETAAKVGVGHIVFLSAAGVAASEDRNNLFESYYRAEQTLMRVANKWTSLRMAYFAESFSDQAKMGLASGIHASFAPTAVNFVSRDDVAAAAAGILATDGHHGAIYHATGPAALTGDERAVAITKASGQQTRFVQVTPAQLREGMAAAGLPPHVIEALVDIQQHWAVGGMNITTGDVERLSGQRPRALADVLAPRLG